jgi:hypothetical protein
MAQNVDDKKQIEDSEYQNAELSIGDASSYWKTETGYKCFKMKKISTQHRKNFKNP